MEELEVELQNLSLLMQGSVKDERDMMARLDNILKTDTNNEENTFPNAVVEFLLGIDTAANTKLAVACNIWLQRPFTQQKLSHLNTTQRDSLVTWLHRLLESVHGADKSIAISSLCLLLKPDKSVAVQHWEPLCDILTTLLWAQLPPIGSGTCSNEIVCVAVQCVDILLGSLATVPLTEPQLEMCKAAAQIVMRLLYELDTPCMDASHISTYLLNSVALLKKVAMFSPTFPKNYISDLLGVVRAYICYDLKSNLVKPQRVRSSQQSIYDSAGKSLEVPDAPIRNSGGKVSKTRKPRGVAKGAHQLEPPRDQNVFDIGFVDIKTSDSDASDIEGVTPRRMMEAHRRARVRLNCVALLNVVVRASERRVLYGYWHALFPTHVNFNARTDLLYVSLHDSNMHCRAVALQIAAYLIFGSKNYLSQAEKTAKLGSSSYISFTENLGLMIDAIYRSLTTILTKEYTVVVLAQALKCLGILVQNTPFHRLSPGYISSFMENVRPLLYHSDITIVVAALMILEFLLAVPEQTPEMVVCCGLPALRASGVFKIPGRSSWGTKKDSPAELLATEEFLDSDIDTDVDTDVDSDANATALSDHSYTDSGASSSGYINVHKSNATFWLPERILQNLEINPRTGTRFPTAVRIASLQVLTNMAKYFRCLSTYLDRVAAVLQSALQDTLPDTSVNAARCLDNFCYEMGRSLTEHSAEIEECDRFWSLILPTVIMHIAGEHNIPTFKVLLCDALSNIGVVIFERLPHTTQIRLLSFLTGASSDPIQDSLINAAAVRALAVYVSFPSLQGNLVFIENVAELTLRLVTDSNLLVRIKAVWSMGNVSDALINNFTSEETEEHLCYCLLSRLIKAATGACSDNDKVRCNAVRALGNFLCVLTISCLDDGERRELFKCGVQKLIDCILTPCNAKVKWNSCYSIGNVMGNGVLFIASERYPDLNLQKPLFEALCHVISNNSNFKVRINATAAIRRIDRRAYFGPYLEMFWSTLLAAIDQSHHLDNFYEYNHRDNLQEQLCLTICHLVSCGAADDFVVLKNHLVNRVEVVRYTWTRVINRMVPEKAAPLLACPIRLQERFKERTARTQLSSEQAAAMNFIAQTFATS